VPKTPDVIDMFFAKANPNPERKGCPARESLNGIADKTLPLDNPAWLHLAHCSPCYNDLERFKEAHRALASKLPS